MEPGNEITQMGELTDELSSLQPATWYSSEWISDSVTRIKPSTQIIVYACGVFLFAGLTLEPLIRAILLLIAVLGMFGSLSVQVSNKLKASNRVEDFDEVMLEGIQSTERYVVEIAISQFQIITGRDRGVMWEEDGKICFNGHACSFSVGGADLTSLSSTIPVYGGQMSNYPYQLDLRFCVLSIKLVPTYEQNLLHFAQMLSIPTLKENRSFVGQSPPLTQGPGAVNDKEILSAYVATIATSMAEAATMRLFIESNVALIAGILCAWILSAIYLPSSKLIRHWNRLHKSGPLKPPPKLLEK